MNLGRPHDIRCAAWRPDGQRLLVVGNQGMVGLWDGNRTEWTSGAIFENLRGCDWSPDGEQALVVGNSGALLRITGGRVERVAFHSPVALRRVAWSPSGDLALAVGNDGLLLEVPPSGPPTSAGFGEAHLRGIAWRPDGGAAVVFANGGAYLYERNRGGLARLHREPRGDLISGFVDADGETVWACGFRSDANAVERRTGVLIRGRIDGDWNDAIPAIPDVVLTGAARLPDGRIIAVGDAGETGVSSLLAVLDGEGRPLSRESLGPFHPAGIAVRRRLTPVIPPRATEIDGPDSGIEAVVFGSPRSRFFRA